MKVITSGHSLVNPELLKAWNKMSEIDDVTLYRIIAQYLDAIDPYVPDTDDTDDTVEAKNEAQRQLIAAFGSEFNFISRKILTRFHRATKLGGLLSENPKN